MKCAVCQSRLIPRCNYAVKGKRYGTLPGIVHVYWCPTCRQTIRFLKVQESLLQEWAAQWEQRRREWLAEEARLAQKLYWLTQPTNYAERKLQEIRRGLIALMERTF